MPDQSKPLAGIESLIESGLAQLKAGQLDSAEIQFRDVLRSDPDNFNALHLLGVTYVQRRQLEQGIEFIKRALAVRPTSATALNNLGYAYFELRNADAAAEAFQLALQEKPDDVAILTNLGNAKQIGGHLKDAAISYGKALAIKPAAAKTLCHYVHTKRRMCDWSGIDQFEADLFLQCQDPAYDGPIFPLLAIFDDPAIHRKAATFSTKNSGRTSQGKVVRMLPRQRDRIRIAYLSADFRGHAISHLVAELFEHHDRERFEIYGISYGPDDQSPLRARILASFDHVLDAQGMSDAEISDYIRQRDINIAVDLTGHTHQGRPWILASRPADIQINFLGYPGTIGVDFIDYVIADRHVLPLDTQPFYHEKIIHLPHCYQPNGSLQTPPNTTLTLDDLGLPRDGFVFCNFNNSYKISPSVFDLWMKLLRETSDSVLWLLEDNRWQRTNLQREAVLRDVRPERIIFAQRTSNTDHLARHRFADLFLDTSPYCAHTTASDALRMGLPVLTYAGKSFASRVSTSLLTTLGLPELVTTSPEQYFALAHKFATQPKAIMEMRQRLEQACAYSVVFNPQRFARDLEAIFLSLL